MYTVLVKNSYAALNIDSFNRTAVCDENVPNGSVFALKEYSEDADSKMVWKGDKVIANAKTMWMASSPEIVVTELPDGTVLKGIDNNIRNFVNIKGHPIDVFKLTEGDVLTFAPDDKNTTMASAKYLIPDATSYTLKEEKNIEPTSGMYLRALGSTTLHIGNGDLVKKAVPAYKFEVVVA